MSKLYIVMGLHKEAHTQDGHTIPLSWTEGQIGALAVFDDETKAHAHANTAGFGVMEVEVVEKPEEPECCENGCCENECSEDCHE